MPDVQNVFRRGGAYWWRRTLTWWDGKARPITLSLSLGTKDLGVARHRAAAMTAQSEVVRMSLYERIARDGLTIEQRNAVLRAEMRAYRDSLEHLSAEWQFRSAWAEVTDVDADLQIYEVIWGAFAKTGVVEGKPSVAYADEHFCELTNAQRAAARRLVGSVDVRASLLCESAKRLESLGIAPNPTNMALAMRLMLDARSQAVRELRLGIDSVSGVTVPAISKERQPAPIVAEHHGVRPMHADATRIPEKWRHASPVEAAELLITSNPAMLEHRKDGKRAATQVGEQTLRQIRCAISVVVDPGSERAPIVSGLIASSRRNWDELFPDRVRCAGLKG